MNANLFTALFLLLLTCGTLLCGHVFGNTEAHAPAAATNFIELFDKEKITNAQKPDGAPRAEEVTVKDYHSPVFVSTNKALVALAGVNRTSKDGKRITVLTKYIVTEDENDLEGKMFIKDGDNGGWKKQFAVYDNCQKNSCVDGSIVRDLAAAVKGDKIYLLLTNITTKAQNSGSCTESKWCFWLVVGDATQEGGGKPIKWGEKEENLKLSDDNQFKNSFKGEFSDINLYDSSAFVIKEKKIVFIVKSQFKEKVDSGAETNKNMAAVFLLGDETKAQEFKLVHHESSKDCCSTFFQFEGKIFKISTDNSIDGGKNKVMVLDAGEVQNFKEVKSGSIFRVRDFLKGKENFFTATIRQKGTVLLFTQQQKAGSDNGGKKTVFLWMTDGTRVSCAGTISPAEFTGTFYASLLYTKDKLFALHQTVEAPGKGDDKIQFALLKDQLKNITDTLEAWKKSIQTVSKLCENTDKQKFICTKAPPTNGIVGFLHNTINEEGTQKIIWKDEYYFSNVTVENGKAEKVQNGLKFSGKGAGTKWSVGKQNENFLYNFTDPGFALVATVEIGSDRNNKKNFIFGIALTSKTNTNNNVGFWCTADGKWGVSGRVGSALKLSGKDCKQGNTYNVALVLNENNKSLDIYVNGEKLTFSQTEKITILPSESIENFYFGANVENDESHVTVTNVLLYNRPFENTEIDNLREYVKSVEVVTPPDQAVDRNTTGGGNSDEPTPPPFPTSTKGKEEDEKGFSPSRTEDGGVGGGVHVFSLLLAVLSVCAPLLHL